MSLSGAQWVNQFPTSASTDTLVQPLRGNVNRFIAALNAAGAPVHISATLRPPRRAYLMHYSYRIAHQGLNPQYGQGMDGCTAYRSRYEMGSASERCSSPRNGLPVFFNFSCSRAVQSQSPQAQGSEPFSSRHLRRSCASCTFTNSKCSSQ